jgi:hypothetical protein
VPLPSWFLRGWPHQSIGRRARADTKMYRIHFRIGARSMGEHQCQHSCTAWDAPVSGSEAALLAIWLALLACSAFSR